MNSIRLGGNGEFLSLNLVHVFGFPNEPSLWGGYDLRIAVEVKSGNFYAKSIFYSSSFEIDQLFQQLDEFNAHKRDKVIFKNYEDSFSLELTYYNQSHVNVRGAFSEGKYCCNKLGFKFDTDKSYILSTIFNPEYITKRKREITRRGLQTAKLGQIN